ncbi:hypothetical protein INR49_014963 [Caranx melampygus]|nr:hypothetical protein INR49_014963 [Caranx melampygus]
MCRQTQREVNERSKGTESASSERLRDHSSQPVIDITEDGLEQNYADIHFSGRKFSGARRKRELKPEESLYAQVQCKM